MIPTQRVILGAGLAILLLITAASIGLDVKSRSDAASVNHTVEVLKKISDVQLLAASCDAVLLVARAYATPRKALEKAVQDLAPFRIIGTVLNAGRAGRYRYREDYY